MKSMFAKLLKELDDLRISHVVNDLHKYAMMSYVGKMANYQLIIHINDRGQFLEVIGLVPIRIPKGCRPAMAEAISRMNYGAPFGKFSMDFDDGRLFFQTGTSLSIAPMSKTLISHLINTALVMLDRYVPAAMSVVYGNETAADAVRHVEEWRG